MNADSLFSESFPHGTPSGYARGCHGSHCPAVITCRDVHRRYAGDFTFRRMIDAGASLTSIIEHDQQAARDALQAVRDARRAVGRSGNAKPAERVVSSKSDYDSSRLIPYATLVAMLREGLTDRQIGDRLGLTRRQVTGTRNGCGLKPNPADKGPSTLATARVSRIKGDA